jgi:hypothetical protein
VYHDHLADFHHHPIHVYVGRQPTAVHNI